MLGIFVAVLLSVSRVPAVMSDDYLLPKTLSREHPRYQTPYISIVVCALVVSFLVLWPFSDLLVIDISLYGAGISLEFIALIQLRKKVPAEIRPFKIPLGKRGLVFLFIPPFFIFILALSGALLGTGGMAKPALFAIAAILSAPVAWMVVSRRKNFIAHRERSVL
jgi:amino acid transporter